MMAKQALTTQAACGSRFTLGLDLSHKPMIEDVMGLSYDKPARHIREYLEVTRSLINGHTVGFQGQDLQVKADLTISGALPVPIVIALLRLECCGWRARMLMARQRGWPE